jgi:hypothetical protein
MENVFYSETLVVTYQNINTAVRYVHFTQKLSANLHISLALMLIHSTYTLTVAGVSHCKEQLTFLLKRHSPRREELHMKAIPLRVHTHRSRPDQTRPDQIRTEQNRTEQNRTEQNRTEQNRTEQNRTKEAIADQTRPGHINLIVY